MLAIRKAEEDILRRAYADTALGQIHYRDGGGSGEPLILLHASPRSSRVYAGLIPLLAPDYRVFAMDTLGSGNSDPLPDSVTMDELARGVVLFMDALGIERANVFGLHTGNKIGAALGANWPDRVKDLILCGETHSIVVRAEDRNTAIHAIVDRYFNTEAPSEHSRLLADWASGFTNLSSVWWHDGVLATHELSTGVLDILKDRVTDFVQARSCLDVLYNANFSFDFSDAMRRIPNRTLIIELARAEEAHLGRQGASVVKLLSSGTLVTMEDTSADVIEFEPSRMAESILDFLGNRVAH